MYSQSLTGAISLTRLGRRPHAAKITGSNPVRPTNQSLILIELEREIFLVTFMHRKPVFLAGIFLVVALPKKLKETNSTCKTQSK